MIQLLKLAIRDLGRNRRRSFFSSLAVGMGLALLLLMASFVRGEMSGAMDSSIRLQSGHLQIRAASYDERKTSLKWEDLVENPETVVQQIASLPPVKAATPRLFATGIISVRSQSTGVRVWGIDPASEANTPYHEDMLGGQFITADDREGLVLGKSLAQKLGVQAGDTVSLSVNTSDGDVIEQPFTVRGVFSTRTYAFDSSIVLLPLAKAQAMTRTEGHASTIFVLLNDKEQTEAVASALQTQRNKVLTWTEMNEVVIQTEAMANSYMAMFYLIVLGITATVIVNTLIMAVFERTREIGILAAIGMKSRSILGMFLAESTLLALGGIVIGLALGLLVAGYFARYGFNIEYMKMTGMMMGNIIYAKLSSQDVWSLTLAALVIALLAGLYPAILAARMEPVQALRDEK